MSDNPDILNLGVESSGFGDLTNSIDAVNERLISTRSLLDIINQLADEQETAFNNVVHVQQDWNVVVNQSADAFQEAANASDDFVGGSLLERIKQAKQATDDLDESIKHVADDTQQAAQAQSDWQGYLGKGQDPYGAYSQGYGTSGGMIGPAEDTGDDGGGGGGSLFGVARGLRAGAGIGRIFGAGGATTTAFTGAADVLYLEEAFKKLGPTLAELGPALPVIGAGFGAIVITAAALEASLKPLSDAFEEAVNRVDAYETAVTKGATSTQLAGDIAKKQGELQAAQAEDLGGDTFKKLQAQYGDVGARFLELYGSTFTPGIKDMNDQGLKAADSAKKLTSELKGMDDAAKSAATVAADQADAARKYAESHAQQASRFAADDNLTQKAAEDRINTLNQEIAAQQQGVATIQKSTENINLDATQRQANADAIAKHQTIINADKDEIAHLNDVSLGLIETRKKEADAIKQADETNKDYEANLQSIIKAQDAYDKTIQAARDNLIKSTEDLSYKERVSEQQYTPGSEQDTFARDTIALKEQRDVSKIETETGDKIADIRTKLGETEAKLVTDYNRQIYDDQIKYQESIDKLVTAEHNQEIVDGIDHANKLADIRHNEQNNELDDIANRDFIKLAKDQRSAEDSIAKEDTSFTQKEENQRRHLAQQELDFGTALANQEKQQQVAEGRKIADAQLATDNTIAQQKTDEQRKIDVARTAEQQQTDDLERNNLQQITLKRQQAYNEYELQVIAENQREQLALQTQQAIVSQSQAIMSAGTNAYINDLNRLNQMAYNGGSAVSIPASNNVPAPSQWGVLNPPVQQQTQQASGGGFDLNAAASQLAGAIQGVLFGS